MNEELLNQIEREVLSWPGVSKDPDGRGVSVYRLGRRQIGHVHHDGVADIPFSRAVHDELISSDKAEPHRGGFPAVVSYYIRASEDVPEAVELFRAGYERAKKREARHAARTNASTRKETT